MATKNVVIHVDMAWAIEHKMVDSSYDAKGEYTYPCPVVLKSARKEDGIRRAEMMLEATKLDVEEYRKRIAFYQYPTCVCSVLDPVALKNMSLEDFISVVEEADIDEWEVLAYDLNPQWKKGMRLLATLSAEEEKKTGTSSNGSTQPMETQTSSPEISLPSKS